MHITIRITTHPRRPGRRGRRGRDRLRIVAGTPRRRNCRNACTPDPRSGPICASTPQPSASQIACAPLAAIDGRHLRDPSTELAVRASAGTACHPVPPRARVPRATSLAPVFPAARAGPGLPDQPDLLRPAGLRWLPGDGLAAGAHPAAEAGRPDADGAGKAAGTLVGDGVRRRPPSRQHHLPGARRGAGQADAVLQAWRT